MMMDRILPPRVEDELNLTAEQKTKLAELDAAFKKDAEKWRAAHPFDPEAARKARESGDEAAMNKFRDQRKELMDTRKGCVDKFRETLTAEQKEKLDTALEQARRRRGPGGPGGPNGHGPGSGGTKSDTPPSPPPDKD